MSDKDNYNYAIEKYLAKYGGEADKDITRTCGNCCAYDSVIAICNRDDEPEDTIEETEQGCWYHMTHDEHKRLEELVKQRQDEANRLLLEEQRREGTGDCAGCPFRETYKKQLEKIWKFVKIVQDMRDTQKAYFKTRDRETLLRSKSLEAKVDVMADEMIDMIGDATPAEE